MQKKNPYARMGIVTMAEKRRQSHSRTSLFLNPYALGVVFAMLLVGGLLCLTHRTHYVATEAAARNCTPAGLVAYAVGNTSRVDAMVEAATNGNVPEASATCSTP